MCPDRKSQHNTWNHGDTEAVAKLRQREGKQNAQTFEKYQVMLDEGRTSPHHGQKVNQRCKVDLEVLNVVSVESNITEYFVSSEAYQ